MAIIFIILKLIIFWAILFFFGYQSSKWLFKNGQIEKLVAFAGLIGPAFYVFLINIIGHFIPIKITFYLVLLIFIIVGVGLSFINKSKILNWEIDKRWRKILLIITLLLIIATFIVDNRYPLGGDQLLLGSLPTAITMAEGNFPPKAIWIPQYPLRYHYGVHLFAAAIYKTTGLPLYISHDIQIAILIGTLFLLGFVLIKEIVKDNKKALISSILMLYAGGLVFFEGIKGIPILYNKYILGQEIFAPFEFVFKMVESLISAPALERMIQYPTNGLGFALMMGIIYLYIYSVKQNDKKIIIINAFLLITLALFAETIFAVFCFLLLVYPFIFGLFKRNWLEAKKLLISSLLMIAIAIPISFFQGGVLTYYLGIDGHNLELHQVFGYTNTELIEEGFNINKTPWILITRMGQDYKLPIYSFKFLLQWGPLLFLVIMATIYFWKKYSEYVLFLILSFFTFFVIPLFILFPLEPSSMERFFFPANLFGGLLAGLFLADLYFKEKNTGEKWLKNFIIFIVAVLTLQGVIFQLIFLTIGYPPAKWNNSDSFFVKKNYFEAKAYEWVRKNTEINDYFLILKPTADYGLGPNLKFILNTGRIAPVYSYGRTADMTKDKPIDVPESYVFKQLEKECDSKSLKYLKYDYLYVDENWVDGFEDKCLAKNNLELKFEAVEGNRFVRIYKVL